MHGLVKIVNGHHILHWTLGGVYYFTDDKGNWVCENKDLKVVEDYAKTLHWTNKSPKRLNTT